MLANVCPLYDVRLLCLVYWLLYFIFFFSYIIFIVLLYYLYYIVCCILFYYLLYFIYYIILLYFIYYIILLYFIYYVVCCILFIMLFVVLYVIYCLYIPASQFGEPHIYTLDGYLYTYNPIGEFWMIKSDYFLVQARTVQSVNDQEQLVLATQIQAYAMQSIRPLPFTDRVLPDNVSDIIHVELNNNRTGICSVEFTQ